MPPHNQPLFADHLLRLTAAIRDPGQRIDDIEPRRLQVYQRLFFNNTNNFISSAFPVFKRLMPEDWWLNEVRGFMKHYRCQSPRFYAIAEQFIEYCRSDLRPETPIDPPFMHELLHYEWVELYLELAEDDFPEGFAPSIDQPVRVSPLVVLQGYRYPVHTIGPENQPQQPTEAHHWLLIYRNQQDKIHFEHLSPFSAQLFYQLQTSAELPVKELLIAIAAQNHLQADNHFINQGLALLLQWHQRGIVHQLVESHHD